MPRPLLLIDCYLDRQGGARNFLPVLQDLAATRPVQVVRPAHESYDVRADDLAGVIITGSAASCCEIPGWVTPIMDLIRACGDRDVPVLGVCFGHQILARALLGRDAVRPAPEPELGWLEVSLTAADSSGEPALDPITAGLDREFRVFVSHREEVTPAASGSLRVLARSRQCQNHAFRVPGSPMWGVQFHAEMGIQEARRLVIDKAESHPEYALHPPEILARARDTAQLFRQIMGNFLPFVVAGDRQR